MSDSFKKLFEILDKYDVTLSSAESLTGGMFGERFTSIEGASKFYWGGVISYAADAKIRALGVPADFVKKFTVVSKEVVRAMANGVLAISSTDAAVAVTGIAGPGGSSEEQPVGTVWICAALATGETQEEKFSFKGSRDSIRTQTCDKACDMLSDLIIKHNKNN